MPSMAKRCVGVPFSKVKTSLLVAISLIVLLMLVLQKPNPPTHGMARMVPAGFCGSLLSRMKLSWFNSVKASLPGPGSLVGFTAPSQRLKSYSISSAVPCHTIPL